MPRALPPVLQEKGLEFAEIVPVEIGRPAAGAPNLTASVPAGGEVLTLELYAHSVRSERYQVLIQQADGGFAEIVPGPVRTMRGTVAGVPGSVVAASVRDGRIEALVLWPDETRLWIEPVRGQVAGIAANAHAVYRDEDVSATNATCGFVNDPFAEAADPSEATGGVAGSLLTIAELAIDADVEYVSDFLTPTDVEEQINNVINTVNLQYERDLLLTHFITTIILRTAEPDPYSQTDPDSLLDELKLEWDTRQRNQPRDLTQLFTGKNLAGTAIGVAWRGTDAPGGDTVCGPFGYSVVESNCPFACGSFASKTDLSAHELGHNWGADHCDCACELGEPNCMEWTMNASLTGANQFHATFSIPEMLLFRESRTCLDLGDQLRRLFVSTPTKAVPEGEPAQFTATADLRFGGMQDVTDQALWTVDPLSAGIIDETGLFTPAMVAEDTCVIVTASYVFNDTMRTDALTATVLDGGAPLALTATEPPSGAIDARRPLDPETFLPLGWRSVDVTLTNELCSVLPQDFQVSQVGGLGLSPDVVSAELVGPAIYRVTFNRALEPGAWTDVTHTDTGTTVRLGFLPGDVDQNGVSDGTDLLALVDLIRDTAALPPYASDIDHSGRTLNADLLTLVELLRGTDTSPGWLGRTLP